MTHKIRIDMDNQGNMTYSPSTLQAKTGHIVNWTSGTLGQFAVSFTDQTPFSEVTFSSKKSATGEYYTDDKQILKNTIGHHHYAVAVAKVAVSQDAGKTADSVTVFLDSGCPDIVVSSDQSSYPTSGTK